MANIPEAAQDHYRRMQALQVLVVAAGRRAWSHVDPDFISQSWRGVIRELAPVVTAAQVRAATSGSLYGAASLAAQDSWVAPDAFLDPSGLGGYAADGRPLDTLLLSPALSSKTYIGGGASAQQALVMGASALDTILRTTIADAGRQAAGVDVASRRGTGYVRMLNPPSCVHCIVLAGRFYRWNTGFKRHPRCDCIHVPSMAGSMQGARDEGLIDDPKAYFDSLSPAEQNKAAGVANAQAIRDGADLNRVANARRGRNGLNTTEGTGRGGFASNVRGQRLTPEGIYKQAGTDRAEALRLLEQHGYTFPGGKTPKPLEGFGQMGRGGTRVGARSAVEQARATGVRTGSRATMTAAERRLYDSEQRWGAVLEGRNPYSRDGSGLTPRISAQVETDYRRWLTSGGQIYTS